MPSILPDPNNHVPGVNPDDSWDDANECPPGGVAFFAALPRKRPAVERSLSEISDDNGSTGLRIEPNLTRVDASDMPRRIEVQEINGSVIRLEDAVPAPPKAVRQFTFRERGVRAEDQKNPRGEGREWGVADRKPNRWLLGVGAGVVAIIILPMALLPMFNARNAPKADPEKGAVKVEIEEKIEGMEALDRILMKQTEAMQIYRAYSHATHIDEILPLIRDGVHLKETLRSAWQPLSITRRWSPASNSAWAVYKLSGHPCALLEGHLPDQSKYTAYFTNERNRLLLDWKATSAYGTASFKELEENTGNPDEIRGLISIAEFYSAVWPEADYQSYRFVSPDGEKSIWCYSRRDDASVAAIAELFRKGEIIEEAQTALKITLRLERGPAEALSNQWLIREMLHIDWLAP